MQRELDKEWTVEVNENDRHYFRHVNGCEEYGDFDYKVEDGKTYYCHTDNPRIQKKGENIKYCECQ